MINTVAKQCNFHTRILDRQFDLSSAASEWCRFDGGRNQLLAISLAITLPVNSFRSSLVHHFLASVDAINEALEPSPAQTFANQSSACKKRLNVSTDHPEMNVKCNEVLASKAVRQWFPKYGSRPKQGS